jgi:hypothetical protein
MNCKPSSFLRSASSRELQFAKFDSSIPEPGSSFLSDADCRVPFTSSSSFSSQLAAENSLGSGAFKTTFRISVFLDAKKFAFVTTKKEDSAQILRYNCDHFLFFRLSGLTHFYPSYHFSPFLFSADSNLGPAESSSYRFA